MLSNEERLNTIAWQNKLRVWMQIVISIIGLFFLVSTYLQLDALHERIENKPKVRFSFEDREQSASASYSSMENLFKLEAYSIEQRYHQANTVLMSRIWMAYLGFVTGMILAIVGAVFILGKLKEDQTEIEAKSKDLKFSILSTSPGIILVVMGTILMMSTLLDKHRIEVTDTPLYVYGTVSQSDSDGLGDPINPFEPD